MPDATAAPPPLLTTKRKVRAGWSLLAAGALILGSVYSTATPAEAAPGDASATGASVHLGLALGGEQIIDENIVLAEAIAPAGGGTDSDALIPLVIDEEQFELRLEVITAEATRAADGSDANAEVANVLLRLADQELLAAQALTAEVECPTDGPNTAEANTLGLQLGGESIADANLPTRTDIPLDVQLLPDGIVDAFARVQLNQIQHADEDGAQATALVVNIRVIATLADNEVVDLEVGDVVLADARCESANGDGTGTDADADGADADGADADGADADGADADGADADGADADGADADGADADGADGADADGTDADGVDADGADADGTDADGTDDGIDGVLPDDGDDDADGTDADGTDADGTDGLPGIGDDDDADGPSADSLDPDSGPTTGGTEVTVDGSDLDRTETVTVGGTEVEFEVNEDGTQLTFVTPPGEAGTVDVVLTYDDGSSDTLPFTYTDEGTDAGTDTDGTAVFGESTEADGTTDAGTTAGATTSGLPVTGAQSAPASAALALLLMAGGAWLLAWRERSIPIVD